MRLSMAQMYSSRFSYTQPERHHKLVIRRNPIFVKSQYTDEEFSL